LKIGQWRSHLPYKVGHYLTQSPDKIYVTTEWAIFSIDKASNEVSFLSKVEGLSDVEMNLIKYDPFNKTLIAVYNNSNVDLITEEAIINLPFIAASQGAGDKRVLDIFVVNENVTYLAMGFGLKILDVKNQEFTDETKAGIAFNSVVFFNNAVYAATPEGVYRFDNFTSGNIQDFSEWDLLGSPQGFPEDYGAGKMAIFNDALYVSIGDTLFRYDGNNAVDSIYFEEGYYVHYLNGEGSNLIVGLKCCIPSDDCTCNDACKENCDGKVLFLDANGQYEINGSKCVNRPRYAIEDEQGRIWYADSWRNLRMAPDLASTCSNSVGDFSYNSPLTAAATGLAINDNNVWVATELQSISPKISGNGFYSYIDNTWTNYTEYNRPAVLNNLDGYVTVAIRPDNQKVYLGTVDDGLVELVLEENDSGKMTYNPSVRFNDSNSPLRVSADPSRIRVTGLAFDQQNNLWMLNHGAQNPLVVYKNDGEWSNDFINIPFKDVRYLVVDQLGYKWFSIDGGSGQAVVVYDDNGTIDDSSDDRYTSFGSGNSELSSNFIFSLAVDLDGDVWVGTTEGIVIFECGGNVFDESCRGSRRILEVEGFNGYLLETEEVTAIAVDGANRKWVGTGNGIFVFSPSGEEQIAFFDKNNSPLFDNQITAIAINQNSGEVYIGTTKGLISYRSDAVMGGQTNSADAFVFPNPVRPDYDGPIAIKGLARDANIKITDINGQLVYETQALGGQAIWDGKDYNGRKASSGVYLVFSTNTRNLNSPDAIVGKILFMQ
jgi:hypothetical protein